MLCVLWHHYHQCNKFGQLMNANLIWCVYVNSHIDVTCFRVWYVTVMVHGMCGMLVLAKLPKIKMTCEKSTLWVIIQHYVQMSCDILFSVFVVLRTMPHECSVVKTSIVISIFFHFHHLSPLHSFTPGLKPSFSTNPSHCSLRFLLPDWLYEFPDYLPILLSISVYTFYFLVFLFSTF